MLWLRRRLARAIKSQGPVSVSTSSNPSSARTNPASPDFNVPERARTFLKYIVTETLSGRADRIKAYSIAVEVFGRTRLSIRSQIRLCVLKLVAFGARWKGIT